MGSRRLLLAAAVVVLAVAASASALALRPRSGIDRALGIAADPGNFESSVDAGVSFAEIAELLFAQGTTCAPEDPPGELRCEDVVAASVHPQMAAYRVLRCSPADVEATRAYVEASLRSLADRRDGADTPEPSERPPRC